MSKRANSEGSIYKRSDGRWCATISVENGRRHYFYGSTRQEVAGKLTAALRNRQLGVPPSDGRQTVGQYSSDWLKHSVRSSVRPRTFEAYDLNVRRLAPYLGRVRLNALTPVVIERAYNALLQRGLSRRSVEQAHAVLHHALVQALRWGLIGRNPADAVNVPRPPRKEMRTLTQAQVEQLFAATASDRLHALWVLLTTTGLRLGEALGVRWEDLDFEGKRLTVKRALQRQRVVGLVFVEPKSAKSRRTVHLAETTVAALREHRRQQLEERLAAGPGWQDHGLVLCREDGRPLEPSGVAQRFHSMLAAAGLPQLRVHDLRHTAATLLLTRGVHPKLVQELLGHSTISLTLDTYSHVAPALHADVAAHMDALFTSR